MIMKECKHCGSKFRTDEALQKHILDKHVAGYEDTAVATIPEDTRLELGISETELEVISSTLAPGATVTELKYFLNAAKSYGLSPVKKEIYFTKLGGRVTLMVSRDGYLSLAHRNPSFRGLHSGTVYEKDTFTMNTTTDDDGEIVQEMVHIINAFGGRGKIVGAWARIDMADQAPVITVVDWNEYNKGTTIWKQYGAAMIRKVAENVGLKRISDAAGLVSVLEMSDSRYSDDLQRVDTGDDGVIDAEIIDDKEST